MQNKKEFIYLRNQTVETNLPNSIHNYEKKLFKKSLCKSSKWKNLYKTNKEKFIQNKFSLINFYQIKSSNTYNNFISSLWYYGLDLTNSEIMINEIPHTDYIKAFKDKQFLSYYLKVITSLEFQEYNEKLMTLFGTLKNIIICYYLSHEQHITPKKIRSLLSFITNENSIINISNNNAQIDLYVKQIQTGVKETVFKDTFVETGRVNYKCKKNDLLNTINHSIRVKYKTTKMGKHSTHKSPITHVRREHTRILKSGKVIRVRSSIIN